MSFPSGVCRFCGLTADQLDGKDRAFLDAKATRCNAVPCVLAYNAEYDRMLREESKRRGILKEIRDRLHQARRRKRRATA